MKLQTTIMIHGINGVMSNRIISENGMKCKLQYCSSVIQDAC